MTKSAIPKSHGISVTKPNIFSLMTAMLPEIKVSPIHAIPKMATTACIPALKTELLAAFIPLVPVSSRISAATDSMSTSMMCAICITTTPSEV